MADIRVVHPRLGVDSPSRGRSARKNASAVPPGFRAGSLEVADSIGVGLRDEIVVGALLHCITTESLSGPVNLVAPSSVTNKQFTQALGKVLSRPTVLPMPAFAARLALGEMADELLLASARVIPAKLHASSYTFQDSEVRSALHHLLNG